MTWSVAIDSAATRVVLVRHGEGRVNIDGVIGGLKGCTGLTVEGRRQVQRLQARWLRASFRPGVLITSPVQRARETALLLAAAYTGAGVEPVEDCAACEMHLGQADGLTWKEYETRFGRFDMNAAPDRPFAPGAESWNEVQRRVGDCLRRLASEHPRQTVVVVTHAGFIVASMLSLLGISRMPGAQRADLDPWFTSITCWDCTDHRWTLRSFNDVGHLEGHDPPS